MIVTYFHVNILIVAASVEETAQLASWSTKLIPLFIHYTVCNGLCVQGFISR